MAVKENQLKETGLHACRAIFHSNFNAWVCLAFRAEFRLFTFGQICMEEAFFHALMDCLSGRLSSWSQRHSFCRPLQSNSIWRECYSSKISISLRDFASMSGSVSKSTIQVLCEFTTLIFGLLAMFLTVMDLSSRKTFINYCVCSLCC